MAAEPSLLQRLKERKLVQWGLAYLASAWVLAEATSTVAELFHWPEVIGQAAFVIAFFGFLVVLVLAWFHGERGRQRVSGSELLIVTAVLLLAGTTLSVLPGPRPTGKAPPPSVVHDRRAIAVLPFRDLNPGDSGGYFAIGLHDELLTQLAKVSTLRPIGRTSVMGYAGTTKASAEIARELGVGSILLGSVQVEEDHLRVRVQLVDADRDREIWAERYDRTLEDALAIQADIAQKIVAAVGGALSAAEARAIVAGGTKNPEAYRLFLQAVDYERRPASLSQNLAIAQSLLERAVAEDSAFALAHAALSMLHGHVYWYGYDPTPARRDAQRTEAETALRLAPDLPEAHRAMVYVHYYGDLDYAKALDEARALLQRLPGSEALWADIGYLDRRLGNWDEALSAFQTAQRLDPRAVGMMALLGGDTFRVLHRFEESVAVFDRILELTPDFHAVRLKRAWALLLWHGDLNPLRSAVEGAPEQFGALGSSARWRALLALWERDPESLLRELGDPSTLTFEARLAYEPGLLYAAWAQRLRGDDSAARAAFAGALTQLDSAASRLPDDWRIQASRGVTLAALGRTDEAAAACRRIRASAVYEDRFTRPVMDEACALIHAQAGFTSEALGEIEKLVTEPSWTSAQVLRLDPRWDILGDDPRFQRLIGMSAPASMGE